MTCTKCGKRLTPGIPACESCGAPVEFSAADRDRMKIDINARVMWGDLMEDIRTDWLAKGAPPEAVRDELVVAYGERQRHFRTRGLQDLLMGLGALALGGGGAAWIWLGRTASVAGSRVNVKSSAFGVVIAFFGAFLLVRGIHRLLTGGAAEKSASDLSGMD